MSQNNKRNKNGINNRQSAGPASGNSSFLPSISGRPDIGSSYGARSLAGIRNDKSINSSNNKFGNLKL